MSRLPLPMPSLPNLPPPTFPMPGLPQAMVQAPQMAPQQLSPQQEQSLISTVSRPFLGGLATLGAILDTPGAIVRNTIAGKNPLLGLFEPDKRTTGRDVLGIENDPTRWEASDFLGFLAEVGLDPLTYTGLGLGTKGLGALTKGGAIAERAGLLGTAAKAAGDTLGKGSHLARSTTSLNDLLDYASKQAMRDLPEAQRRLTRPNWIPDEVAGSVVDAASKFGAQGDLSAIRQMPFASQPLGGQVRLGLPFTTHGGYVGNSPRVAKLLDSIGEGIKRGNVPFTKFSPGVTLGSMFSRASNEGKTAAGQLVGRSIYETEDAARASSRASGAKFINSMLDSGWDQNDLEGMRKALEHIGKVPQELQPLVDQAAQELPELVRLATAAGMDRKFLQEYMSEYFPRFITEVVGSGRAKQVGSVYDPSKLPRLDFLRDLPEGTASIIKLAKDQRIADAIDQGLDNDAIAAIIKQHYPEIPATFVKAGPAVQAYRKSMQQFGNMSKQEIEATEGVMQAFAEGYKGMSLEDFIKSTVKTFTKGGDPAKVPADAVKQIGGAIQFGRNGKALMQTFDNADVRTHLRQFAGVARRQLTDEDTAIVNKFVGAVDGMWSQQQEQLFADSFERYLREGKAPSTAIGKVFKALKDAMTNIYQTLSGTQSNVKLTPELEDLYGRMIGGAEKAYSTPKKGVIAYTSDVKARTGTVLGNKPVKGSGDLVYMDVPVNSPFVSGKKARYTRAQLAQAKLTGKTLPATTPTKARIPASEVGNMKPVSQAPQNVAPGYVRVYARKEPFESVTKPRTIPMKFNRHKQLASWLKGLSPETRATGVFGNNPVVDYTMRLQRGRESIGVANNILDALADPEVLDYAARTSRSGGETVPLHELLLGKEVFRDGKRFREGGLGFAGNPNGGDGPNVWKALAERMGGGPSGNVNLQQLYNTPIPKDFADDLRRMKQAYETPETVSDVLKIYDSFASLFKGAVTTHPAFHARNFVSGQFHNAVLGMFRPSTVRDAYSIIRGKNPERMQKIPVVQRILKERGMANNPENATRIVRELSYTEDLISPGTGVVQSVNGELPVRRNFESMQREFPGGPQANMPYEPRDTMNKLTGRDPRVSWKDPLGFRGVGDRVESTFPLAAASDDAGYVVEAANRLAPFIKLLEDGWSPAEAARKVRSAQVDYSGRAYTSTERAVIHRMFPFAKFSTRVTPQVLKELVDAPGGRLAQTIRGTNYARDDEGIVPEYISQGLSIPLPPGPSGQPRYLTGLGLMHEDPASFIGRPQDTALELASRLNPILKFPLEFAVGESFYQRGPQGGRDLQDLDPVVGRIISNVTGQEDAVRTPQLMEHALMNSPVARLLTSIRQISDSRKGYGAKAANLLTGLRISDVSPQTQEAILRERLQESLRSTPGARAFERVYVPDEVKAGMTPVELQQAEQIQLLLNELARRAKDRARAKEAEVQRAGG